MPGKKNNIPLSGGINEAIMSKKIKKDMGESVRARLLNLSKETGRDCAGLCRASR